MFVSPAVEAYTVVRRSSLARWWMAAFAFLSVQPTLAAETIHGQVLGAGAPIIGSAVTLWAANIGAPKQLAQTRTGADGRFEVTAEGLDGYIYLVAKGGRAAANEGRGDNSGIVLMSMLGTKAPANVVINELTTVASVFTAARFISGESISGNPLGLRIAAGNVPNLVDPETGTWGKVQSTSPRTQRSRN